MGLGLHDGHQYSIRGHNASVKNENTFHTNFMEG